MKPRLVVVAFGDCHCEKKQFHRGDYLSPWRQASPVAWQGILALFVEWRKVSGRSESWVAVILPPFTTNISDINEWKISFECIQSIPPINRSMEIRKTRTIAFLLFNCYGKMLKIHQWPKASEREKRVSEWVKRWMHPTSRRWKALQLHWFHWLACRSQTPISHTHFLRRFLCSSLVVAILS